MTRSSLSHARNSEEERERERKREREGVGGARRDRDRQRETIESRRNEARIVRGNKRRAMRESGKR